jgi:hypothetical protein
MGESMTVAVLCPECENKLDTWVSLCPECGKHVNDVFLDRTWRDTRDLISECDDLHTLALRLGYVASLETRIQDRLLDFRQPPRNAQVTDSASQSNHDRQVDLTPEDVAATISALDEIAVLVGEYPDYVPESRAFCGQIVKQIRVARGAATSDPEEAPRDIEFLGHDLRRLCRGEWDNDEGRAERLYRFKQVVFELQMSRAHRGADAERYLREAAGEFLKNPWMECETLRSRLSMWTVDLISQAWEPKPVGLFVGTVLPVLSVGTYMFFGSWLAAFGLLPLIVQSAAFYRDQARYDAIEPIRFEVRSGVFNGHEVARRMRDLERRGVGIPSYLYSLIEGPPVCRSVARTTE